MDTFKDKRQLDELNDKSAPWKVWAQEMALSNDTVLTAT
jgi:hypothetical protein